MINYDQAERWGTLLGIFAVAFLVQWNQRKVQALQETAKLERAKLTDAVEEVRLQGNSELGAHLRLIAEMREEIANRSNDPVDRKRAEEALRDYQKHIDSQALIAKNKQEIAVAAAGTDVTTKTAFAAGEAKGAATVVAETAKAKADAETAKPTG